MDRAARWVLAALLAAAPLPFGAVLGWTTALYAAALGGLLIVVVAGLLRTGRPLPSGCGAVALAGGVLAVPALLQLVPLPPAVMSWIAPATARFRAANSLEPGGWQPVSQDPAATADALLWLGACTAAAFLVAALCRRQSLRRLLLVLLAAGTAQAFYGILEFLSGRNRIFFYTKRHYLDSVTGTYINRNHFAGLMVMLLPVGLAWLLGRLQGRAAATGTARGLRHRLLALADAGANQTLLLALAVAVMGAGLALSFSRAGVTLGLLVLAAVAAAAPPAGARHRFRPSRTGLAAAAVLIALAMVPLAVRGPGRLASMAEDLPAELAAGSGRPAVWAGAVRMAGDHPVLGTGLGTFGGVFPRYRPLEIQSTYTHAHQDYLQWLAETGLLGGLAGLLVLMALAGTAVAAVRRPPRAADRMLAAGVAAGLGGMALHGLVDFNGHIPANTLLAAALAGALVVLSRPATAWEAGA